MTEEERREPWTIVLAGGEGMRLRSLTRALHGEDLPKQFACIEADRSLLQSSVTRSLSWSVPEHVVVVVSEKHEELARGQLAPFGHVTLVTQPSNLGTGPGILLPLTRVLRAAEQALVVVLPSDQFVRDEAPFRHSVRQAAARAAAHDALVVIGAVPDLPDPQYGWIVPRSSESGELYVHCFEEKPPPESARRLFERGALWNTFVLVAPARRLWQLAELHLPEQCRALAPVLAERALEDRSRVSQIYQRMPAADFSRDVLEHADGLELEPLSECGWSDWGTPERVVASLRGTSEYARFERRLRAAKMPDLLASRR